MATRQKKQSIVKRLILPSVAVCFLSYFGFHSFHGSFGYFAHQKLLITLAEKQADLDFILTEREALELRVALLRPESLDRETVDEYARSRLNLAHPNDVVILYSSN